MPELGAGPGMWITKDHECQTPDRMPILEKYEDEAQIGVGDIWRCGICLRNHRVVDTVHNLPTNEIILMFMNCGY